MLLWKFCKIPRKTCLVGLPVRNSSCPFHPLITILKTDSTAMFNVSVPRNFKIAGRACHHLLVKSQEKHCFSNSKFNLNENGEILQKTFNSYFELIIDSLELFGWTSQLNIFGVRVDPHFAVAWMSRTSLL